LNGILHRRRELTIGAAELFEQHVSKSRIGCSDSNRVHKLLDVVIHATAGCKRLPKVKKHISRLARDRVAV
jgi:hypothetical protein